MANRTGTYIAFHAGGTTDPTASDIKYYNVLKAWDANNDIDFSFVNSHDKTSAVRDSSKWATLQARLKERLNMSKNFLLIVTADTKLDTDCVPFEIRYGVDDCKLPIIAAYPDYKAVLFPNLLSGLWPAALASRIGNKTATVLHIPFCKEAVLHAITNYSLHDIKKLRAGSNQYTEATHRSWGLLAQCEAADRNYPKPPTSRTLLTGLQIPAKKDEGNWWNGLRIK